MDKIWEYKNPDMKREELARLSETYRIPRLVAAIMINRGLDSDQKIKNYFTKSMQGIRNPVDMKDMDAAVERICRAVDNGEKIVVYGDYDVDGITSTALMYRFLTSLGANTSYYIPDRRAEGYGINCMAVNRLKKSGTDLIVSVDCGITAVGETELARAMGMDVVITDHHTCKDKLPTAACAVVNPKRPDCEYGFDGLAGVGVAFKLALAIGIKRGFKSIDIFKEYVELAAVGTIADVVPLTDENRVIVDRGLRSMENTKNLGLSELMKISGADKRPMTAASIAFAIAPRLNAAGRMGSAETAVELLLTNDREEAYETALKLDETNRHRQITEQEIFDEAMEMIASDGEFDKNRVIVLAGEGWHQGVIGIVASRISDRFYRPCILISYENGIGKGSGRSIEGFNLFDALDNCAELLTNFGGHAAAAGLNLKMSDFEAFRAKINEYAKGILRPEDMKAHIKIDCRISPRDVNMSTAEFLKRLEPYGMGNEKPVFAIYNIQIGQISRMGLDNKHLRLRAVTEYASINCVGFGMGSYYGDFRQGDYIDIAFAMDINEYQGSRQVQLVLKDMKRHRAGRTL